jgi:exopolyphosphatase/guanosine-5'-triphosphate,3'-diphosphate pyrophosphatase
VSWRSTRASGRLPEANQAAAVIDLGSNSWRTVVYHYSPGHWWRRSDELFETVRIGAGMDARSRLSPEAIARGLETLRVFARFCHAHRLAADEVHAVATSAVRDAVNREELLEPARRELGLPIQVLSEREEARFGYLAAVNSSTLRDGLVAEIGGGSLQLVQVGERRARECRSFPLGALRMTETYLASGQPARRKDLTRLRRHVRAQLADLPWRGEPDQRLVGVGGAVRNLAAAAQRAAGQVDLGVQGFLITAQALEGVVGSLAALPAAERAKVAGIKPGRADIILAAAVVLQTVLEESGCEGLEATEASMRDGIFLARTLLRGGDALLEDVRAASVRNLAVQYEDDLVHVEHVSKLALELHDSLAAAGVIRPQPGERELLWAAGMLHDVGMTIAYDDHHKHSRYLIVSAELPGFDPRERALVAQMTRYHRKGAPKLGELGSLAREGDEELLERCAILLRLAEHLERGRDQSVTAVRLLADPDEVALHLQAAGDLTLPRWSLERYGDDEAFRRVFGRSLVVQPA